MAFSSSLRRGSRDAGTVRLTADTGEFNAKVEQAERQWRESVGSMSKEAIKLDLAQDRLKRSLARYGAESSQAKRATIQLKDAQEAATRSARGLDRANDGARRSFTGLRAAAVGAVASVGVYGLASALRSAVDAAKESELVLGQTKLAVEAAGESWERYEKQILDVVAAQSRLGFDDETLLKTFSTFVNRTKDVSEALRLNALAADVARGRYIDLEQAAQIVIKASLGQSGALRRMGIDVEKNATGMELLARLTEVYGGRAQGALGTATAATERMSVSIENAKELIGGALTPAVADLANRISDYLDDAGRQEEIQRRVNEAVSDASDIIRGFVSGMRAVKRAVDPVVQAVGGLENAARLLFAAFVISKIAGIATAIRGIGLAAAFSRGQVAALAATPVGPAAGRGAGALGFVGGPVTAVAAAIGASYFLNAENRAANKSRWDSLSPQQQRTLLEQEGLDEADLAIFGWALKPFGRDTAEDRKGGRGGIRPGPAATASTGGRTGGGTAGNGLSRIQSLELAASRAGLTKSLSDDLAAARAIQDYYAKVASNEKLKGDALFKAQQDLVSALARTQAVEDQIAAGRLAAAQEAAEKRRASAERLAAERRKERERMQRQASIVARELDQGPYATTSGGFNAAGVNPAFAQREHAKRFKNAASPPPALTREDLAREMRNFLVGFDRIQNTLAGTNQRPTVVVNQTFPEPTPDRNVEARYARFAFAAAFEG